MFSSTAINKFPDPLYGNGVDKVIVTKPGSVAAARVPLNTGVRFERGSQSVVDTKLLFEVTPIYIVMSSERSNAVPA